MLQTVCVYMVGSVIQYDHKGFKSCRLDRYTAPDNVVVLVWEAFSTVCLQKPVAEYSVVYFLPLSFFFSLRDASCYILLLRCGASSLKGLHCFPQTAAKLGYLFIWLLKCNCSPLKPQRGKSFALAPGQ